MSHCWDPTNARRYEYVPPMDAIGRGAAAGVGMATLAALPAAQYVGMKHANFKQGLLVGGLTLLGGAAAGAAASGVLWATRETPQRRVAGGFDPLSGGFALGAMVGGFLGVSAGSYFLSRLSGSMPVEGTALLGTVAGGILGAGFGLGVGAAMPSAMDTRGVCWGD